MRCSEVPRGPRAMLSHPPPRPPPAQGRPPTHLPTQPRPPTHHHQPPSEVARTLRVLAVFFNQHLAGGGAAGTRSVTPRSAGRSAQVVRRLQRQAQPAQPLRACGAGAGFFGCGARVAKPKEEVFSLRLGLELLAVIPIPGEVLAQYQSTGEGPAGDALAACERVRLVIGTPVSHVFGWLLLSTPVGHEFRGRLSGQYD